VKGARYLPVRAPTADSTRRRRPDQIPDHNYLSSMRITAAVLLLPTLLSAEPALKTSPAVALSYETDPGKFCQLQSKTGGTWKDLGPAIKGTGKPVTITRPAGDYRVVTPADKWVLVWSDEFDGDTLDTSKWAREENNYGGGNNERQAYRTDPKYCHVKDGKLNIALYREPHTASDGKTLPYSSAPYDQPFHLIINLAVDGRFFEQTRQRSDNIPADDFPQVFQIDYARVYQWSAADKNQR
jgi:hypothetical protein